jgi:hypothetical protein
MNLLSRDKQIEVIAALTEGVGIRATARLTGVNRETVGKLALQVGKGCAELHDRRVVGVRTGRLELDELWAYVGKKQNVFVPMKPLRRAISTHSLLWPPHLAPSSPIVPASATALPQTILFRTSVRVSWGRQKSAPTDGPPMRFQFATPSATARTASL